MHNDRWLLIAMKSTVDNQKALVFCQIYSVQVRGVWELVVGSEAATEVIYERKNKDTYKGKFSSYRDEYEMKGRFIIEYRPIKSN